MFFLTSQRLQMRRMEADILFFYLNTIQQKFQYCQQQLYRFFLPFIYKENQNLGQCCHFLHYCMLVIYIDVLRFMHVQTFGKKKILPKSQRTQGFNDLDESIYEMIPQILMPSEFSRSATMLLTGS